MTVYGSMRTNAVSFPQAMTALSMDEPTLLAALQPGELIIVGPHKRAVTKAALERIDPGSSAGLSGRQLDVVARNDSARW